MGTKVQYKSYISGYHPIRDLNEDRNFSWPPFCEDKTFSGQLCNDFKSRGVSGRSDYDKEMLKQTMIEHEAIFQKQVYELHRLYRIQKELMHELKKKQQNRFSGSMETSMSSMFPSQMPPEFGENLWHPPLANTYHSTANLTVNHDKRSSLYLLKEDSTQSSSISTRNGGVVKDDRSLNTKLKTTPKRMFDLRLPADVYIENEDTERTEKENVAEPCAMAAEKPHRISATEAENDLKLTLGNVELPVFSKGILKSNLHYRNGLSIHSLADLNEPFKDSFKKGILGSGSCKFSGLNAHDKELQQPWTSMRSKSSFTDRNFFMDKHLDGISFNCIDKDEVERQEGLLLRSNSGQGEIAVNSFSSSLFSEKYPMSSESIKLKLDKARQSHLPDQNQTETWVGEKTTHSIEITGSLDFVNSSHAGCTASQVTPPLSIVSPFYSTATPPLPSSWRKPSKCIDHIPFAVEAFPSFSETSMFNGQSKSYNAAKQSNNTGCDKLQCTDDLQPHIRLGNEFSSHANGRHHGIPMYFSSSTGTYLSPSNLEKLDLNNTSDTSPYENSEIREHQRCSRDLKFIETESAKDLNLNDGILGDIQDGFTDKHNLDRKHDELSKGLIWLREKPSRNGSAECRTQLNLRFTKDYSLSPEFLGEDVQDKGSPICALKHSLFDVRESRIQRSLRIDSFNYKGIFNLPDNTQRIFDCSNSASYGGQSLAYEPQDHGKGKAVRNRGLRNGINLNLDLMPIDDVNMLRTSAADESHIPSSLCLTRVASKLTSKIDLAVPADEMEEENTHSGVEIVDTNHPMRPVEISQEKISSNETCMKLAADTIVSMSVDVHNHSDKVTCFPFAQSSCDSLHLLAEVATSNAMIAGESKASRYGSCEASADDGLDVFESMTLKLEELKSDECFCIPYHLEKPKDEKSMALLLLTKPRRGQARKRRQRRDFQKDILPALASLSRHEVTEDLQALGGMTRTAKSRQNSSTRRSTSQDRLISKSRGRRRPGSLANKKVSEVHGGPPPMQPIHTDLEKDGRNIMAWGRTTRRCRRQRMPSGQASAPRE